MSRQIQIFSSRLLFHHEKQQNSILVEVTVMNELDRKEQEILATFEAGEWQSVQEPNRLLELQSYAKATISKDKRITLRLSSADLEGIQTKALEEGIPYQTLISSVIHKYVTGRLVDKNQQHSSVS
jgi:predicted DNA binding CopG/RHH family protein